MSAIEKGIFLPEIIEFVQEKKPKTKLVCGWCKGLGKSPENPEAWCGWCGGQKWF